MTTVYTNLREYTCNTTCNIGYYEWQNPPIAYTGKGLDLSDTKILYWCMYAEETDYDVWSNDYTDVAVFNPEDGYYIYLAFTDGSTFPITATFKNRFGQTKTLSETVVVRTYDPRFDWDPNELYYPQYFPKPFCVYTDIENFYFVDITASGYIFGEVYQGFEIVSNTTPIYLAVLRGYKENSATRYYSHIYLYSIEPFKINQLSYGSDPQVWGEAIDREHANRYLRNSISSTTKTGLPVHYISGAMSSFSYRYYQPTIENQLTNSYRDTTPVDNMYYKDAPYICCYGTRY